MDPRVNILYEMIDSPFIYSFDTGLFQLRYLKLASLMNYSNSSEDVRHLSLLFGK